MNLFILSMLVVVGLGTKAHAGLLDILGNNSEPKEIAPAKDDIGKRIFEYLSKNPKRTKEEEAKFFASLSGGDSEASGEKFNNPVPSAPPEAECLKHVGAEESGMIYASCKRAVGDNSFGTVYTNSAGNQAGYRMFRFASCKINIQCYSAPGGPAFELPGERGFGFSFNWGENSSDTRISDLRAIGGEAAITSFLSSQAPEDQVGIEFRIEIPPGSVIYNSTQYWNAYNSYIGVWAHTFFHFRYIGLGRGMF